MCSVTWGYIYMSKTKIHVKDNTWNVIIFTVLPVAITKFGGLRLGFIKKGRNSFVNHESF